MRRRCSLLALRYAEHVASRWYSRTGAEEILEHPVDMQDGRAAAMVPFLAGKDWTGNPLCTVTR